MGKGLMRGVAAAIVTAAIGLAGPTAGHAERNPNPASAVHRNNRTFDPQSIALPARSPEWAARELLTARQFSAAADLLRAALSLNRAPDVRGRLRWLLADAYAGRADQGALRGTLRALANSRHPLAPRARLRLASCLHEDEPRRAIRLLSKLQEGYAFSSQARLLMGLALEHAGQDRKAIEVLEALVAESKADSGGPAAVPLSDLLASRPDPASKLRALSLYDRVASSVPLSARGKTAAARYKEVLASLPAATRQRVPQASTDALFARADALLRHHAYSLAAAAFDEVSGVADDPALVCQAQLQKGRALLRKRERTQGVQLMDRLLAECKDEDVRAWARYYAGQTHFRLDNPTEALSHYDALHREAPGHRLADDALYYGALAAEEADDLKGMRARLQRLVDEHPQGDMRPQALFTLAWEARGRRALSTALRYFDDLVAHPEYEQQEGTRGRAAYWRARTLQDMGRREAAAAGYGDVARNQRLGYHAQLALPRLRRLDARAHRALLAELRPNGDRSLVFPVDDRMSAPGFRAAVALLQVGAIGAAQEELRALNMLGRGATGGDAWLLAGMYEAVRAYPEASAIGRRHLSQFAGLPPQGLALRKWRIAYPNAFSPAIERAAEEAEVPASYVRAVAREESAFNPRAVSSAHAYGLIQLIRPTAREYAKSLGLPSHPAALKQPHINLRIGSRFIRDLWDRFAENPAVVPAAYNAGPYAAERWIRENPQMPFDEWVENIPYSETRRYTRRVLQTYGIYSVLSTGRFPPLPDTLPPLTAD